MNGRHEHRHGVVRRVLLRSDGKVIVALASAFSFGAIDQYLGAVRSPFLTEVSVMSAPWLLVPFLAGASQASKRRAAFLGLVATWLSVLAYVMMTISPLEGTHLGPLGHLSGPFQGTLDRPAAFAEAAFGLTISGVVVMRMARARARPRRVTG